MVAKNGSLSINSENIFPIIKKWLYSDHDIFYRELISNGCDAVTKLKKLDMMGEYSLPEGYKGRVDVIVDPEISMHRDAVTLSVESGMGSKWRWFRQIFLDFARKRLDKSQIIPFNRWNF